MTDLAPKNALLRAERNSGSVVSLGPAVIAHHEQVLVATEPPFGGQVLGSARCFAGGELDRTGLLLLAWRTVVESQAT